MLSFDNTNQLFHASAAQAYPVLFRHLLREISRPFLSGKKGISCVNHLSGCRFGSVILSHHMHSAHLQLFVHSHYSSLTSVCRFTFEVYLNVTGAAHYVVMPANASLPTVLESQTLTTQAAGVVFPGNTIAASGDMSIPKPFTNYSQVVLVRPPFTHASAQHLFTISLHNILDVLCAIACVLLCDRQSVTK